MTYLADTLFVYQLIQAQPKIARADASGILSNVEEAVVNYAKSQWDGKHSVSSLINLFGPSLLFRVSPILGLVYELTEAFGFDWRGLIEAVGRDIENLITPDSSKDQISSAVNSSVQSNFSHFFTGDGDLDKVKELAPQVMPLLSTGSTQNLQQAIKKYALIKQSSFLSRLAQIIAPKFAGFWGKVLSFIITTIVLNLMGGTARGLMGDTKGIPSSSDSGSGSDFASSKERQPLYSIPLAENLPSELTDFHQNDLTTFWMLHGDVDQIQDYLINWILTAYPSLQDQKEQIINSSAFIETENNFHSRNQYANGTGLITVPRPFQRILDIVNYIVNEYLKSHPQSNKTG